jgi:hypothetical protein
MRIKGLLAIAALAAAGWWAWPWVRERLRDAPPTPAPPTRVVVAGAIDGGPSPVRPGWPPGTEIRVELLLGDPQPRYADLSRDDAADASYRELLADLGGAVEYDRNLARAAREIAAQSAARGLPPPDSAQAFILASAGAPDSTALRYLVRTNSDSAEAVVTTIREALTQARLGGGATFIGVGEASTDDDALDRHIAVLVASRHFEIEPLDRRVAPHTEVVLRGVAASFRGLEGNALYPDGSLVPFEVESNAGRFVARVPVGDEVGALFLDLNGNGPSGPGKLLQLQLEVGRALPRETTVWVPPTEPAFGDVANAEAFGFDLLQADRKRHDVPTLELDPVLSRIARSHSEDMRDAGYFAHRSPTTGLVSDRLRVAGYHASGSGENLALNDGLAEAEASLMASVGHRRNILEPSYTHVGIGLAARGDDWFLTQVFARKVALIDSDEARAEVLARLNAGRAGAEPFERDPALDVVAQRGALSAASGDADIDQLASDLGDEAADVVKSSAGVSVQVIYEIARFSPAELSRDASVRRVGVGVAQRQDRPGAPIGVVVVFSR